MSNRTREINRITTTIIRISIKLMVAALLILLLYEAVAKGFAFGYEIFYAQAAEASPGRTVTITVKEGETVEEAAKELSAKGLIDNRFAFLFQSRFYDYGTIYPGVYELNTSMTSKEILQELNEKPQEEDDKTTQKANGSTKQGTKASPASKEASSDQAEAGTEGVSAQTAQTETEISEERRANEQSYAGEEDEAEGGWIEDITEE